MRVIKHTVPVLPPGWGGVTVFCLILIASIWSLTLHRIAFEQEHAINVARQQNQNLALAFEEHIIRTLRGVDQFLLTLKHAAEVGAESADIKHLMGHAGDDPGLNTLVAIIDAKGRMVYGTMEAARNRDFSTLSHFLVQRDADAGFYVGSPFRGQLSGVDLIPVTRRINAKDGTFAGIVTAGIRRDYFSAFYAKTELGAAGVVAYIGDDGVTRASNAAMTDDVMQPFSNTELFDREVGGEAGTFITMSDRDGIERILSFRRLSHYSGVVGVGTSVEETLRPVAHRARWYYGAGAGGTVFIFLFLIVHLVLSARHHRSIVALRQKEEVLEESQRIAQLGSWKLDLSESAESTVQCSNQMYRLFGYDPGEIRCTPERLLSFVHDGDRDAVQTELRRAISKAGEYSVAHRIVRRDGEIRHAMTKASTVRDPHTGTALSVVATLRDITDQKLLEAQLVRQARVDSLTDMPNRNVFTEALEERILEANHEKRRFAVLFVDLDRFKAVNDTLGHDVGDALLVEVGRRFSACIRREDIIARLGGDEFAVIVSHIATRADAATVAMKMTAALLDHFMLDQHELLVTASVGISVFPDDGRDARTLMKNADVAMYRAKEHGPNSHQFYTEEMNRAALERLVMIGRLKHAVERNEFELHYQPVIDAQSGSAISCEALLRWRQSGQDVASPADFVPLLESSGLVLGAGEWVIENTCKQLSAWRSRGYRLMPVAINLSARQFEHAGLIKVIERALSYYGLPPRLLEVEITEGAAMRNPEETITVLRQINKLGVGLKIDDFGTGYSSLAYLKRFPIQSLKIDRAFTRGLPSNPDDVAITQAIITMAHSLGIAVVAEGVETKAQRDFLMEHGCDAMQGFFFARPMPGPQMEQWLVSPVRGDVHCTGEVVRLWPGR